MKRKQQIIKNEEMAAKAMSFFDKEKDSKFWYYNGMKDALRWICDNQNPVDIAITPLEKDDIKTIFGEMEVNTQQPHMWD